jgi:hypothetical protein
VCACVYTYVHTHTGEVGREKEERGERGEAKWRGGGEE